MTSTQSTLLVVGAVFEFAGIVLIGFPDLVPGALRLAAWLRRQYRRVVDRLRRLLRRPRQHTIQVEGIGSTAMVGDVSLVKSVGADATQEQKIDFLLQRDQEAQRDVNQLSQRMDAAEQESQRRLDEVRGAMEEHVANELAAALAAYRPLRIAGTFALALGLAFVTVANFIG